jgi:hypothetical protein
MDRFPLKVVLVDADGTRHLVRAQRDVLQTGCPFNDKIYRRTSRTTDGGWPIFEEYTKEQEDKDCRGRGRAHIPAYER